jgi:hypothetical protein
MIAKNSFILQLVGLHKVSDAKFELCFVCHQTYLTKIGDINIKFHCRVEENYFKQHKQDSSQLKRNPFLFLRGTRVPACRKRGISNFLGFCRNPKRNRNPAPCSCPQKRGTKRGMYSLVKLTLCGSAVM